MLALVTGASRGIGAATAKRLAADGYTVLVHYHTQKARAEALAADIGGIAIAADLGNPVAIRQMTTELLDRFSRVDVLVNNAGVSVTGLFQEIAEETVDSLFAVNVRGVLLTTKGLLPAMLHAHCGSIVNISSIWGEVGGACEVHYATTKAAIIGFTKALAKEVGPSGIRVNCVAPGVIATDMNAIHDAATLAALAEETPLCRIGTPEEVADAVSFLVSEQARFVTGQVLSVGGGFGK